MFNFIKKQFIDIIQWENPDEETLVWRFPIADQEIQNGASLTVREAQMAMFVDEGKTADVFGPGRHKLTTQTLPVLTYLKNWDKLFQSPFKSDVYFFNTRQQIGKRWGTAQPVTVRDADFGVVQLRSFGMYSYRIADPAQFFKEISGVVESYTGEQLEAAGRVRRVVVEKDAPARGDVLDPADRGGVQAQGLDVDVGDGDEVVPLLVDLLLEEVGRLEVVRRQGAVVQGRVRRLVVVDLLDVQAQSGVGRQVVLDPPENGGVGLRGGADGDGGDAVLHVDAAVGSAGRECEGGGGDEAADQGGATGDRRGGDGGQDGGHGGSLLVEGPGRMTVRPG